MRLHKRGPMMLGHHHMKRKLFKRMMLRSMLDADNLPCKKKHFKRMMKGRRMMNPEHHGKDYSSSNDDSHHHHGKKKHMMKRHFMMAPGRKYDSSSDSDDDCRIKKKHFKRMIKGKWKHMKHMGGHLSSSSDSDDSHHGRKKHKRRFDVDFPGRGRRCMSPERSQQSKDTQGLSKEKEAMPPNDKTPGEDYSQGPSTSHVDEEAMQGRCMSEAEVAYEQRDGMGKRRGYWTDIEERRHGKGRHFGGIRRGYMSAMDHHGKSHKRELKHQFKKCWKKGYKSGYFDDDSALVPICSMNINIPTLDDIAGIQTTGAEETGIPDGSRTRDQGTQTTGIMEIVIEDQEAQNAAIRIVNKFL